MIVGLLGTPSPLTYVTSNILRAIVQVTSGEHHMIGANCVADLRDAWPDKGDRKPAVVLASDMPHDGFAGFLAQANVPLVLCVERLEDICNYMIVCRNYDGISAIRAATQSLSNLEPLAVTPPAGLLRVEPSSGTFGQLVSRLLIFFRLRNDDETVNRVAAHLGFENRAGLRFADFFAESRDGLFPELGVNNELRLTDDDYRALHEISQDYNSILEGRRIEAAFWQPYYFLQANTPGLPVRGNLVLEGRARFLTYGPYLHLPRGTWGVEVIIDVGESYSENRIGFDIQAGTVLAARTADLPEEGVFACDMAFRVVDPNIPIEIRIQLINGAIEGKIHLRGARFSRIQGDD